MLGLAVVLAPVIVRFLAASVIALLVGAVGGASLGALLAERKRAVKRRYVEGELAEWEFEREMGVLLSKAESDSGATDYPDPLDALDVMLDHSERIENSEAADATRSLERRAADRE